MFSALPILLAAALAAPAAAPDWSGVDRYIRAEMELKEIPGLAIAVAREGAIVAVLAWGVRNLESGAPMTTATPVELASLSKPLTAMAVDQLRRAGKLDLDAPLARYLPEFASGWPGLTPRHLLRQTSGLRRWHDFEAPCCGQAGEFDLALAARKLARARFRQAPEFRYANSNYVILAALVERVSGLRFTDCMTRHVFAPLGMNHTTLHREQAQRWGLAESHERQWGRLRPSPPSFLGWYGSSQVKSSAEDMGRYLAALTSTSWEPLQAPYDQGWFLRSLPGLGMVAAHTGDLWGSNTAVMVSMEKRLGVVVLGNAGSVRAGEIARGVLERAAGLPGVPPARVPKTVDPDFWAILFLAAAWLIAGSLAVYVPRAWIEWRRGGRGFRPRKWTVARATMLGAMAAYLGLRLAVVGAPPVAALPKSLQTALPALVVAVMILLVAAALAGLAPRDHRGGQPLRRREIVATFSLGRPAR